MGIGSRAFLAGGLGFAAAFVVACGSSNGLLSADQASSLSNQLDSISSALTAHQCGQAAAAVTSFDNAVANLPGSVNGTLVRNLGDGAATVSALASKDCTSSSSQSTSSSTTTTNTSTATATTSTSSSTPTSTSATSSSTGTATNPAQTGTATTSNGGAGLGGGGGATTGAGGGGQGNGGGNAQ